MRIKKSRLKQMGRCFVCAAVVLLASPTVSWAGTPQVPSATEVYGEAQKLFDKGRYAEALVGFRQAYNASNSPNARLMVGHCLIALGKPTEAYTELAATLREAQSRASTEPKYEKTRDAAAAQLALLEGKVGKVVVEIDDRSAEVTVNGNRIAPDNLGTVIAVDPGTVMITAKHVDGRTVVQERVVAAGATETVALKLPSIAAPPPATSVEVKKDPVAPEPREDKPAVSKGGGVRAAGVAVLGVGVAGMAMFAITGTMAKNKFATLETECGGARCTDLKYADVIDSGKTLATVANVGLGVGAAGIVAGGLMMIFGGASKSAPTISIYPGGTEVHYRLTF